MKVTEAVASSARPGVPSGTVTFLFTDIEGSTRLLERLRDQYATLLADHAALLRATFGEWGGFEVDTQGDSFFVAFPRATDALQCAIEAQRRIGQHQWPAGAEVRVRMALHTGEPLVERVGYVGMDVHRAARIGAAGHGGQVIVSEATRQLVASDLPSQVELVSLGAHRLKDLRRPVELYQVRAPGLLGDFPPLRTLETEDEPPTPGDSPYKGLEYFDEADAPLFFGREALTARLVERLTSGRFLAVVGASGSGKSSVVRAGAVPALRATSTDWTIRALTPTGHPLEALALAVTADQSVGSAAQLADDLAADDRALHLHAKRLGGQRRGARLLLIVDQFEELFTLTRSEEERRSFVDNLVTAALGDGPISILITLRADFYDRLAAYDRLRALVSENQEYIGPMSVAELRQAVEGPAAAGGWDFSPGLVDLILHDVGQEPGALPLLSHALLETWRRRRGSVMNLKAYAESGGVRGAIARTADRVYHSELDAEQQGIARALLLRLTELGAGTQDTRRRVTLREIVPASATGDAVREVLDKLVQARLVTTAEGSAEIAHEALIREWPQLQEWLTEDREGLRLHRQLTEATREWELLERDPGALYRGARLANALEWSTANSAQLNELERDFLEASQAELNREESEREAQRQREIEAAEQLAATEAASARRLRRRALLLTAALGVAALMAGAAIFLGLRAQQSAAEAEQNFATAESQRLAAESSALLQLQGSGELASLLALRGLQAHYSPQADMALQRAARLDFGLLRMAHPRQVDAFSIASDGMNVATYARDGKARIWSLNDGSLTRELEVGPPFGSIVFQPQGGTYVVASEMGVELRDVQNHSVAWQAEAGLEPQFTDDGSQLFVSRGDRIDVLSSADGTILRSLPLENEGFDLAPDGRQLLIGDRLYDAADGTEVLTLVGHTNAINGIDFSPDGKLIATGSWDETAKIWDRATGDVLHTLTGHSEILFKVSFSPDSTRLITGSLDNTARLWDVATGAELRRFAGHTAAVYVSDFTPDGNRVVTGSADLSVRVWDLGQPIEADTLAGQTSFVYAVAFAPDGKTLFTGSADGTGLLWDTDARSSRPLPYEGSRVDRAALSRDGRYLLLAHEAKPAELWDVATATLVGSLDGSAGGVTADFTADGRYAVAAADMGPDTSAIGLWEVESRSRIRTFPGIGFAQGTITPDGRYIIVATEEPERNITVYSATTGEEVRVFENGESGVAVLAVSPDSRRILTGSRDNIGRIIDLETGDTTELVGHTNIIWGTAFSADATLALTGSQDRTARLWDVSTGIEMRRFASHQYSAIAGVAASPDGRTIAIGNFDGYTQLSSVELTDLQQNVCGRLLRDFLPVERTIYEIRDDRPTCE